MVRIGDPGDARGRSGDRGNQAPKACQAIVASYDTGCAAVSTSGVDRRPVQRLLAEARPYRSHLVATSLLGLLATPLTLLVPLPLKIAIDSGLNDHPLPHLLQMLPADLHSSPTAVLILAATLHVSVILLLQLQSMAYSVLSTSTGEKLTLAFRGRLFRHIQRMSLAYHDSQGTADSI